MRASHLFTGRRTDNRVAISCCRAMSSRNDRQYEPSWSALVNTEVLRRIRGHVTSLYSKGNLHRSTNVPPFIFVRRLSLVYQRAGVVPPYCFPAVSEREYGGIILRETVCAGGILVNSDTAVDYRFLVVCYIEIGVPVPQQQRFEEQTSRRAIRSSCTRSHGVWQTRCSCRALHCPFLNNCSEYDIIQNPGVCGVPGSLNDTAAKVGAVHGTEATETPSKISSSHARRY